MSVCRGIQVYLFIYNQLISHPGWVLPYFFPPLISPTLRTGGWAGVSIDPKWQAPSWASCLETLTCQAWHRRFSHIWARQGTHLVLRSHDWGQCVATYREIICLWGKVFHIYHVWHYTSTGRVDGCRHWTNERLERLGLPYQARIQEICVKSKTTRTIKPRFTDVCYVFYIFLIHRFHYLFLTIDDVTLQWVVHSSVAMKYSHQS